MSSICRSRIEFLCFLPADCKPGPSSLLLSRDCHLGTAPLKLVSPTTSRLVGSCWGDLPGGYWGHGFVSSHDGPKVCSPPPQELWIRAAKAWVAPVTDTCAPTPVHPPKPPPPVCLSTAAPNSGQDTWSLGAQ